MKKDIQKTIQEARCHFENNDFKKSELLYLNLLKSTIAPYNQAVVYAELSWLYYRTKQYTKAIEAAENVLISDEDYSNKESLFRVQGYAYLGLNKIQMAEEYLIQSLDYNSNLPEQQYVKYELGKLYFKNGDYNLALPYMEEIETFFQKTNQEYYFSILFFIGFCYYYLENLEKAKICFEEIIESNPQNQRYTSALFGKAYIEFHNKNYLEVITLCEKIVSLSEDFYDKESLGFLTAASYYYLGRADIYNVYYEKMLQKYPNGRYAEELNKLKNEMNTE